MDLRLNRVGGFAVGGGGWRFWGWGLEVLELAL